MLIVILLLLIVFFFVAVKFNGNVERFRKSQKHLAKWSITYDDLDHIRGVDIFIKHLPTVSMEAIREGLESVGVSRNNDILIFDQKMNSNQIFLTGNADTVYAVSFFNLDKGPVVIEVPPGLGPSVVNSAFFDFIADIGETGVDEGNGGKYLFLPPESDLTPDDFDRDEYFIYETPSFVNLFISRALGDEEKASQLLRSGIKIYGVNEDSGNVSMNFVNGSELSLNTIHENDYDFYKKLWVVLQREPTSNFSQYSLGQMSLLGIQRGTDFVHDEYTQEVLSKSADQGSKIAAELSFNPRGNVYTYENRYWYTPFVENNENYTIDGNELYGTNIDAKIMFYYVATVNSPSMMGMNKMGKGSQYVMTSTDSTGKPLSGSNTYEITIPANIPVANFASLAIYDKDTRSLVQSELTPSRNFMYDDLVKNEDDSITISVGPDDVSDTNYIKSKANYDWFAIFRLYGPLDAWNNKTWKLGEFTRVK